MYKLHGVISLVTPTGSVVLHVKVSIVIGRLKKEPNCKSGVESARATEASALDAKTMSPVDSSWKVTVPSVVDDGTKSPCNSKQVGLLHAHALVDAYAGAVLLVTASTFLFSSLFFKMHDYIKTHI